MSDIVDRLRQHALPDPHDEREVLHAPLLSEAADEIKSLRRQLAEANETLKDHGEIQADLCRQLAECQAREKVLRDALADGISGATKEDIKQAKREQAEKCFDRALLKSNGHGVPGILEELNSMAKELE